MLPNKNIINLIGPTATGKSQLACEIAKKYHLPILNVDSLLLYNELTIGVAKPSIEQRSEVPHYLIDVTSIAHPFTAADYVEMALPLIESLWDQHQTIMLVGGSGFYLKALLEGMFESKTTPPDILQKSQSIFEKEGIDYFINILQNHDIKSFQSLHVNDHYRIRRAVEHFWTTGIPFSKEKELMPLREPQWKKLGWNLTNLYLDFPKFEHGKIIEQRTKGMLENGLIDEVKNLLRTFSGKEKPLQSIGYKECQEFLNTNSTIPDIKTLQERIIISTRQLAKSQRTWFAKIEKIHLPPDDIKRWKIINDLFIS